MEILKQIAMVIFLISIIIAFLSGIFLMLFYIYEIIKEEELFVNKYKKENSDLLDEIIRRDCEIHNLKEHIKNS